VTVGVALGGAALAFALGARTEAGNVVAMHYVRQTYRVGQAVAIKGVRGRIQELTATGVVLESGGREIRVPGRVFSEEVSEVGTSGE
jgi:hypothetical protein